MGDLSKVSIRFEGGLIHVASPYNNDFVREARMRLGGRWSAEEKAWCIDPQMITELADVLLEVYGEVPRALLEGDPQAASHPLAPDATDEEMDQAIHEIDGLLQAIEARSSAVDDDHDIPF